MGDIYRALAHIEHHLEPRRPGDEGSFAFALDLLLDGLARIRYARLTGK